MALQRAYEDLAYRPEYGTLVVRDALPWVAARPQAGPLLESGAMDLQPSGTIARAGDGWLEARAYGRNFTVRLEAHDSAPPPEGPDWPDVVETPMVSGGRIGLAYVTSGPATVPFPLGGPGVYRIRLCARPGRFVLRCWPVDEP